MVVAVVAAIAVSAGSCMSRLLKKQHVQTAKPALLATACAMIKSLSPPHACSATTRSTPRRGGSSRAASPHAKRTLVRRASAARAEVAPEFVDETREIIDSCRSILRGETLDDAFLDSFQDKRRAWFAKYQYHHGKSFYGYANTWNVQAKIGVQIAVSRENGEAYDADHTVYNRDYLLKILDKAEAELLDMQERNAF